MSNDKKSYLDGIKPKYSIGDKVYFTQGLNSTYCSRVKGILIEKGETKPDIKYRLTCEINQYGHIESELFPSIQELLKYLTKNIKEK